MLSALYDSHHSVDFSVVFLWWSEIRKACQFGVNLQKCEGLIWNQTEKNVSRRSAKWDWLLQLWKRVSKRHLPSPASAFKRWMLKRWIVKRRAYLSVCYQWTFNFKWCGFTSMCISPNRSFVSDMTVRRKWKREREVWDRKRFCLVVCFVACMCTSVKFSVCLFMFASE